MKMQKLKMESMLEKKDTIRLGFYPYTYVRTVVMRSLLFRREDYQKMLKMGFSEIAKFLQESNYRKEINELATNYSGPDLLELALNKSLAESFKKLIRISPDELGLLIREYAKRKDIEDLKTIIRGIFTNAGEKAIAASVTGAGTLSRDFLASLLKEKSVEGILKANKLVDFSLFREGLKELGEKRSLAGIENAFDRHYYTQLARFSEMLPEEGELFRRFIQKEVEILNLLAVLRLKKAKFGIGSIRNFIIPSGNGIKDAMMMELASTEDLDNISGLLQKTEYKSIVSKGIEEFRKAGSLIMLEIGLYKHLLKKSMLFTHQHPLSVDVILGYMFAKDIEVRNLKIIVKGKQLGLSEGFMESQLVF